MHRPDGMSDVQNPVDLVTVSSLNKSEIEAKKNRHIYIL